jgi:hypothetical protein
LILADEAGNFASDYLPQHQIPVNNYSCWGTCFDDASAVSCLNTIGKPFYGIWLQGGILIALYTDEGRSCR